MLTITQLAEWLHLDVKDDRIVRHFATDSRAQLEDGLYVPIQGARVDGHRFLEGAKNQGAIVTLWKKGIDRPDSISSF